MLEKPTIVIARRYRDAWAWCVENDVSTRDANLFVVSNRESLNRALEGRRAVDFTVVTVSEPAHDGDVIRAALVGRGG